MNIQLQRQYRFPHLFYEESLSKYRNVICNLNLSEYADFSRWYASDLHKKTEAFFKELKDSIGKIELTVQATPFSK